MSGSATVAQLAPVVFRLEMCAMTTYGLLALFGRKTPGCGAPAPAGLLRHERRLVLGLHWPRLSLVWRWRDQASFDAWANGERYLDWWLDLMTRTRGCGVRISMFAYPG